MLKTSLLALFAMTGSAALGAGAYAVYTPLQISLPFDAALKVTPDPANIWSWHKTVVLDGAFGDAFTESVLVDMNGDGVMDTNEPGVRVLITDIQVLMFQSTEPLGSVLSGTVNARVLDSGGERWVIPPFREDAGSAFAHTKFETPLALPVGSDLTLELTKFTSSDKPVKINIIGRIVNL